MPIPGSTILNDRTKRTNFVVELFTTAVRRWTPYPGGLTVAAVAYTYVSGLEISEIRESRDGSSIIECTLRILNLNNIATPLVTDAANVKKRVLVQRVWFNSNWAQDTVETWFDGFLGRPSFEGNYVALQCRVDDGRRGRSPYRDYATLMTSHTPPAPNAKLIV